ncbi:hypothetical protein DJ93_5141 [Bacillus clarus]|uniref:VTT domain-containing protein n=1 Tax=Bacillus clarus TaxID=2338372 RepID=A0A090YU03_9BACI|nr:hypothetical protein DJ93_5141 [Bacillus clarus]
MLGVTLEVIPSEIVLSYAGYLVSNGSITFLDAVVFGKIGGVIAQLFIYWIDRYGGRPVLERYGKYSLIQKKHIDYAETWFNRYGTGVIFTARFIPVVRHAISIPAGIVKMSHIKFITLTTLAVIPWSIVFVYLGFKLGEEWGSINKVACPYVKYFAIGAIGCGICYFVFKKIMKRKNK